mgnify:CR=1 FL=1|tara:strand:- start:1238 stop:2401 length:1164 start_codon:yes stop_codon:yes gene_type:complete
MSRVNKKKRKGKQTRKKRIKNTCGTLLFYAPSMYSTALEVKNIINAKQPGSVLLGKITTNSDIWDKNQEQKKLDESAGIKGNSWPKFKDGWPNLFIKDHQEVMQQNVVFLASLDTPESIFSQMALMFALPKYRATKYKVIIPWFPTGTMERISIPGEIATANTLSRILSSIPLCSSGPCVIGLIDIHALSEQFYFNDNVLVELKTAAGLLCKKIDALGKQPIIAFPDDGAHKRYKKIFELYFKDKNQNPKFVICGKERDGESRKVVIKDGIEHIKTSQQVIIVDDLVQSGGTLIKCAEAIQNVAKCKISAFVTHGVFPNNSWEKFVDSNGKAKTPISKFYITNSIPLYGRYNISNGSVFEVLSIAPIIEYFISETRCNNKYKKLFNS